VPKRDTDVRRLRNNMAVVPLCSTLDLFADSLTRWKLVASLSFSQALGGVWTSWVVVIKTCPRRGLEGF